MPIGYDAFARVMSSQRSDYASWLTCHLDMVQGYQNKVLLAAADHARAVGQAHMVRAAGRNLRAVHPAGRRGGLAC